MSPTFDPSVTTYTATTSNASNKITFDPVDPDTIVTIKLGGVAVENPTLTWATGANVVTLEAVNGGTSKTYTVTVTK